jgi:hypothetical protein
VTRFGLITAQARAEAAKAAQHAGRVARCAGTPRVWPPTHLVDHGTPAPFPLWVPSGRWGAEVDRRPKGAKVGGAAVRSAASWDHPLLDPKRENKMGLLRRIGFIDFLLEHFQKGALNPRGTRGSEGTSALQRGSAENLGSHISPRWPKGPPGGEGKEGCRF